MKYNILSVVAHPDDEILGFGATTIKLTKQGHKVTNCILSGEVKARRYKPKEKQLLEDLHNAQKIVGAELPIIGKFPNIEFNTVSHIELVQFIEKAIEDTQPDYIFTHYPYDLNNDHYHVSKACQAAARLFQRKPLKPLKGLFFMEIQSSTDWAFPVDSNVFVPDMFVEVGEELLNLKIRALSAYRGVMREYPHPRSIESLKGIATYRGSQAGIRYAEAFKTAFNILF